MLTLRYFLRALQLICILVCLSYLLGVIWIVGCSLNNEDEDFILDYGLADMQKEDVMVTLSYFMFTTLSTVGLGDYHPVNNMERIIGAIILIFGVSITSYVMDNFNFMIQQIRVVRDSFEESK